MIKCNRRPLMQMSTGTGGHMYLPVNGHGLFAETSFFLKKLEVFGGQPVRLLSEDDHSHCAPPYWNITKETISLCRSEV